MIIVLMSSICVCPNLVCCIIGIDVLENIFVSGGTNG